MRSTIAMTTLFNFGGTGAQFTPHRFDHLLLREPDRRAFIVEQDHAEALEDDRAWLIGRSVEAMVRVPKQPPVPWAEITVPA
jgi:hypothetical protein